MAWQKLDTETLTSTQDLVTMADFTSTVFNVILNHNLVSGAGNHNTFRTGNGSIDSGSNYADRHSTNGATDATDINFTRALTGVNAASDSTFDIMCGINISAEEKLFIGWEISNIATGAGTAPSRIEYIWKWVNTSNQFDQFQSRQESGSGDFLTDSNISILGTN